MSLNTIDIFKDYENFVKEFCCLNKYEITKEMFDFFFERTINHINYVTEYKLKAKSVFPHKSINMEHDSSKFEEPELTPFILLTWSKKDQSFKLTEEMREEIDKAIKHHYAYNDHHPEHWKNVIDMPGYALLKMACDYCAMSKELGGNPLEFFENVCKTKYQFTEDQKDFVRKTIEFLYFDK